ncbi:SLATT domain-containing protein [Providencia stuartii]|nr:SLATT domain-containing protein [Providencia stuartii]
MENNNLLKHISETGYNVGYSAKLHFASFEMIEKVPGLLSFISLAFGVYALAFAELSTKLASSTLLVLGIVGLYISLKNSDKSDFEQKRHRINRFV